jgi:hypothetical protein
MGDFSMLEDIPEMYQHCKTTEDKDMTALDFFTDHVMNIDGIFDQHKNGDEQKPHHPEKHHHLAQKGITFTNYVILKISPYYILKPKSTIPVMNDLGTDYTQNVFRPPIYIV